MTVPELQTAAQGGDVDAQYELALHYQKGDGVTRDLPEGARWVRAGADLGSTKAIGQLGYLYATGAGVPHHGRWPGFPAQGGGQGLRRL